MKFICDDMLGRLARWLRILGFDTLHDSGASDIAIISRSIADERVALTKDSHLCERYVVPHCLYIASDFYLDQVAQVIHDLGLPVASVNIMTRCLVCNKLLQPIAKDEVAGRVPPRVFAYHTEFHHCNSCERIYWKGTHYDNALTGLRTIMNGAE